jgi:hypothetical protein
MNLLFYASIIGTRVEQREARSSPGSETGLSTLINLAAIVINVTLLHLVSPVREYKNTTHVQRNNLRTESQVSQTSSTNHAVSHIKIHGFGYLAFHCPALETLPMLAGPRMTGALLAADCNPSYIPVRHHHLRLGIWTPQGIGVAADGPISNVTKYLFSLVLRRK